MVCLSLTLPALPVVLVGCERGTTQAPSEGDAVDALATQLIEALREADRDTLQSIARAELAAELGERDLAVFARTLGWLGTFELRADGPDTPVRGGVERIYTARFDHGAVELRVTVIGDKLEGFHLDEATWQALVDQAIEATAGSLRVVAFAFTDTADPGALQYDLDLQGLAAQLREHEVTIDKSVVDAEGNEVYRQREPDHLSFPQAESGSTGGRVTGTVAVPGPGRYTLKLEITDRVGAQSVSHSHTFDVQSPREP